jgi:ComF family protein
MATLSLGRIGSGLIDLLYPPRCTLCGKGNTFLCNACADALPRANGPRCDICWLPLDAYNACPQYSYHHAALSRLRCAYRYVDDVQRLVHAFKFGGQSCLAPSLGALLADCWRQSALQADVIVAVPLTTRRERTRGYNQAQLLAGELSRACGLPLQRALRRTSFGGPQQSHSLSREERRRNVEGAFALADRADVDGKRVLLIDDIATTGSTLDSCARVLLAAGAAQVTGLTLARED